MSVVSCRECGHSVSDEAVTCPSCGVGSPGLSADALAKNGRQQTGSNVLLLVLVVAVALVVVFFLVNLAINASA